MLGFSVTSAILILAKTYTKFLCQQTLDLNMDYIVMFNLFVWLIDLILYVPSTIFQLNRDRSSWVDASEARIRGPSK